MKSKLLYLTTVLSVFLSACGGGGGGGSTSSPTSTPSPTPTPIPTSTSGSFLYYLASSGNTGALYAVDPASPSSPITVESSGIPTIGLGEFFVGSYASNTLTNLHPYALTYPKSDGKFYKVSTALGSGAPVPTQLSNETGTTSICPTMKTASDYATPDNSEIVYAFSGADGKCATADDVYKMVKLSMSASSAPIAAYKPVTELHDWTTGAISGWLVNDAGQLKHCDANFANCSASLLSITTKASSLSGFGSTVSVLLAVDSDIYVYNTTTNTLSASRLHDTALNSSSSVTDNSNYYFANSGTIKAVYRLPVDGSASATQMSTADTTAIINVALTTNNLVYTTATAIKVVAQTANNATPTALVNVSAGNSVGLAYTNANHIYYTTTSAGIPTAGMIDDTGANLSELASAQWVGVTQKPTISFGDMSLFDTIVRASGYNNQGVGKGFGAGQLEAFDMATTTNLGVLGTVPPDMSLIYCGVFGFAHSTNMLCNGLVTTSFDVLYVNALAPSSLVRITTTPTMSEVPLY